MAARDDERLAQLCSEYQAKHDEATRIISDPAATGEMLVKAEKMFDERDALKKQIEERNAELARAASLRDRSIQGKDWLSQTNRTTPFPTKSGGPDVSFKGFEDGGAVEAAFDPRTMYYKSVKDAGPGTFGEKQWETMSSFEYKRDFMMYVKHGERYIGLCSKTLQEGIDSQGGVFAPAELATRIIGRLPAPTRLRSLVNVNTTGRDSVEYPRLQYNTDDKYSTAFRATWTGEVPSSESVHAINDANLFGNLQVAVHTAMMSAPLTKNLIEDAAFNIQGWLEDKLGEAIDLLYEDMIINGTGVGQPFGILNGASASNVGTDATYPEVVLSGTAGSLTYDGLIDIQTALAPQYENANTRWVMNKKSAYRAINKLKDNQNRPLFTTGYNDSGIVGGRGRVLLGDEIVLSQFMPDVGGSNFPLIYGDLKGYYLFQRVGFSLQVLDQTKAKLNQVELVGRVRFGGKTLEPWRLKIQKSNNS